MNEILFSSDKMDWETPQDLFDKLKEEFNFTLDVAASDTNAKCENYYTIDDDGLSKSWITEGIVWCNPPYGRSIYDWVKKAHHEAKYNRVTTVMLIPARTDTKYFHEFIYGNHEYRLLKGRLKFSNSKNSAPFPSMIVIFKKYIRFPNSQKKIDFWRRRKIWL